MGALFMATLVAAAPALLSVPQSASAQDFNASGIALKFKQANRVAVSAGATGKTVGDILKYKSVATIDGVAIDAVVKTTEVLGGTITTIDEGSAVTSPPPGSTQAVDDLLLTDLNGTASSEVRATLEFSFFEGGTYTGPGTGVPVTLTNVSINSYDIDGNAGVKQFTDFRGFQSYESYSPSTTQGLNVLDMGGGLVRFLAKDGTNIGATSGSYSFARLQVNYDQVSTLTVRVGELSAQTAYYALDFSAGGMWTTNGTTAVLPAVAPNPFNTPPATADITTFFAAQGTGYRFRAADFPYTDVDRNPFVQVTINSVPASEEGALEFNDGSGWVPVTAGQVVSTSDLDLGKLRLTPSSTGGSFTFSVNDGLADSSSATLDFTAAAASQTITFPAPAAQTGTASHDVASAATSSSGLVPTLTSQTTGVCTVNGLTITTLPLPTGTTSAVCVITATQEGSLSYGRAAAVTQQFVVSNLLPQTLTFSNPGDREVTAASITTDAGTSAPGRAVNLSTLTPSVCTISGTSIVPVTTGLCSVRATQPGDSTYSPASPVTQTFSLVPAAQTITYPAPSTHSVADSPFALGASTNATGLAVSYASSTTSVCTVSGGSVSMVTAGICTVTAIQAGTGTYAAAADVTRSFHILQVTTSSLNSGRAGMPFSQTLTVAGAAGGGSWTSSTLPAGLALNASTGVLSGTPTVSYSGDITLTYTEGGASHAVTLPISIDAALTPQTINFPQPSTFSISDQSATVTVASSASTLTPSVISNSPAVCTISGRTVTFLASGLCTLTASEPGDSTYLPAEDVTRSFTVTPAAVTSPTAPGPVPAPSSAPGPVPAPLTTAAPQSDDTGALAHTGFDSAAPIGIAAVLLVLGLLTAAFSTSRRRRV